MDNLFSIRTLRATEMPQQLVYAAMHQDYSELYISSTDDLPDEAKCGEIIVKRLLKGGRGHYGCFEHPSITLGCGYFPHSVMQQVRTHRVGISFDVQSGRYTGQRIIDAAKGIIAVDKVVYLRPPGYYVDRQGNKYEYTTEEYILDLEEAQRSCEIYRYKVETLGYAPEHARGSFPFDVRQHWVMTVNARSLMHLLDLRHKPDAQLECQWFSELLYQQFERWMPEVASWYKENRLSKGRLAP